MDITTHWYDDKWSYTERVYKTRSKLEIHIVDFLKKLLPTLTNKTLDSIENAIQCEIHQFKKNVSKAGKLEILRHKEGTVHKPTGQIIFYGISIIASDRAPAFTISEPIP